MKFKTFLFWIFIILSVGFLSYRISLGYFSDLGQSTDNILEASTTFPTATPTPTPPITTTSTPTPTNTPTPTPASCTEYCQSIRSTMLGCSLNLTQCGKDFGGTQGIQNNAFCSTPTNFCCCQ